MLKRLALAAALAVALVPAVARAQSPCAAMTRFGQVLTLAQWQSCWQAKADVGAGGGGGSITGAQVVAALTYTPANKAGDTFSGKLITAASAVGGAGFNLPHGVAPTSPQNGDTWTTTAGLFVRINGTTIGPITTPGAGFATLASANTFTAANTFQQVNVAYRTTNATGNIALTDSVVCGDVTGGSITLTLPANPIPNGWSISVKDCKRQASGIKVLTVAAGSGQTIEGGTSVPLNTAGTAINGVWNLATANLDLF